VTRDVIQLLGLDESTCDPTSLFGGKFTDVETASPQTPPAISFMRPHTVSASF
jgi:hypothetical protein